ncbi:unnamed protein product [marine sediment metagenome]|uniref:NAD-dependent epimerase/dehydratase domain-containing protein n=1 Tax=marine sediment metagenome TaxID=412755 RepID=X0SVT7_9ZZZZ
MMRDKILITGVNGYLGSKIAEDLISKNYLILGIDLSDSNIGYLYQKKTFKFFKADITDIRSYPSDIKKVDILIHCAALVHKRSKDLSRENYFKINHEGTKNIIYFLNKKKLKQIIFLSTVLVYGELAQNVLPDETTPVAPKEYYSQSKIAAENEIRKFAKKYEIPFTIFRLTPVYGKNFLLNINKRVYLPKKIAFYKIGSGQQQISLCSVHNIIDVIANSINNHNYFNETFIIKDKNDYSINEIIFVMREVFNKKRKIVLYIPLLIIKIIFGLITLVFPQKGKFYKYQIKKITQDSLYCGNKLFSSRIRINWNLKNTLLKK